MAKTRVTIVVVPREQFSKAQLSLESIYAATSSPFELVYVDGNSPPPLRQYLKQQATARRFRLIRTERYLAANEARNIGVREVCTEYVAFLDNDVFMQPGWLDALLRCADETGAWVVGPLYCYGADGRSGEPLIVHTAGADMRIEDAGTRRLHEVHRHVNQPLEDVRPHLHREPIDLVEFHCMLVRTSALDRIGPLDDQLLSALDHVDFCLAVRQAGGSVYFEPDAVVTHLAPPPFARMDLPYFLLRWSDAWLRPSIRHFASKHRLNERGRDFQHHVLFRNHHRRRLVAGARETIRRFVGHRGLRIADAIADRIIFALLIENTIVRRMQRARARNGSAAHGTFLARIQHRIRVSRLNMRPGIQLARSSYIARSAMIQTESDGHRFGGRILVAGGVTISDGVIIATYGGTVQIGANSYIGPYCVLYGHGGLAIGKNTMIGAHTVMVPANHGMARIDVPMNTQPLTQEGINIGEDVWIGSGCKVLDGVRIGNGAVIGAGSVVTRDIDAYSVALGVPATVVGRRQEAVREASHP